MKKNLFTILLTLLAVSLFVPAFSQTKEEEKEWKKKLKDLDPLEYKALVEEKNKLSSELQKAKADADLYKSESEAKDAEIAKLEQELGQTAASGGAGGTENTGSTTAVNSEKGLVYKVQIGAFRNKDLTKYLENHKNFSGEVDADGTMKYTLGAFSEYWEADEFKKYLREMGVKDAWIVSYKDGTRVPIKDALEGVL